MAVAGFATPAAAACTTCNSYVVLTPFRANCFLERVDSEIERLRVGQSPVIFVDLSDCPAVGGRPTTVDIALPSVNLVRPDKSFVADEPMLTCLKSEVLVRMLGVAVISDDRSTIFFDVAKLCQ
jgi:hypothetical protein